MEPTPRNFKDQLDEVTAMAETLRAAIGALAATLAKQEVRAALLKEYDDAIANLTALSLGKNHRDQYLDDLEAAAAQTRKFLNPPL